MFPQQNRHHGQFGQGATHPHQPGFWSFSRKIAIFLETGPSLQNYHNKALFLSVNSPPTGDVVSTIPDLVKSTPPRPELGRVPQLFASHCQCFRRQHKFLFLQVATRKPNQYFEPKEL